MLLKTPRVYDVFTDCRWSGMTGYMYTDPWKFDSMQEGHRPVRYSYCNRTFEWNDDITTILLKNSQGIQ